MITEQSATDTKNTFYYDLCTAFVAANIAWTKLDCPELRQFLEKYCKQHIPSESTIRKNYLEKCYLNVSSSMKIIIIFLLYLFSRPSAAFVLILEIVIYTFALMKPLIHLAETLLT